MKKLLTKLDLLVFPLVTAAAVMVTTTIWVPTVPFGRLPNNLVAQTMSGTGDCITMVQMWVVGTTISISALVFVVWGISSVGY